MNQPAAQDAAQDADDASVISATTLVLASLCGFFFWSILAAYLGPHAPFPGLPDAVFWMLALPPAAAVAPLCARLLRTHRWLFACACLALFPVTVFAQYLFIDLMDGFWQAIAGTDLNEPGKVIVAIGGACVWLWAGLYPYAALAPLHVKKRLHKGFTFLDLLLTLLLLGIVFSYSNSSDGYSPRARVSELILAGSSAKTALSEGMQTYGSWSPEWMSAITISASGMVARATIGPRGVITVSGTAAVSGAIITMIPATTTDNKLVWSCIGTPAKYMPASCR
ncbi:MAG TPA: pilin [Burkholderiales bacterium]|jgi:type IV pilus assembly protein PilA